MISLHGQIDINQLLLANVREGLILPDSASVLCKESKYQYHTICLSPMKDGATYVLSEDIMILQTHPEKNTVPIIIERKDRPSATAGVVGSNVHRP